MRTLVCKFDIDFLFYFSFRKCSKKFRFRAKYIFIEFMKFLIGPKKFCLTENKAKTNKTYDHVAKIFLGLS